MKKIDLEFSFKGARHHAVVRIEPGQKGTDYHITVMDGDLESLLYGNHIIREEEGCLHVDVLAKKLDQTELKLGIASSLGLYLGLPCFVGDQCMLEVNSDGVGWEHLHPIPRHGREEQFSLVNCRLSVLDAQSSVLLDLPTGLDSAITTSCVLRLT